MLILVAVLGFMGLIGPTEDSLFGPAWYFDDAENWAHLVLGVVGLGAAFVLSANLQKMLVGALGVFGVLVGVYSLFGPITQGVGFLGAQLQNPLDTILHLVVGAWALAAAFKK